MGKGLVPSVQQVGRGAHPRRGSAYHLTALLLLAVVVVAGLGFGFAHVLSGRFPSEHGQVTAAQPLQVQSEAGDVRIALDLPGVGSGAVKAHLWQHTRPLYPRSVLLAVSQLGKALRATERMTRSSAEYRARLPWDGQGWREVTVSIRGETGRDKVFSFAVQRAADHRITAAYPLLAPVGGWKSGGTLQLGHTSIGLHLSIGAIGTAQILISTHASKTAQPSHIQLVLSMLDMGMPPVVVTASPAGQRRYAARAFFSMPGLWRIVVRDGRARAAAAILVGHA